MRLCDAPYLLPYFLECARIWLFIPISRFLLRQGRAEQAEFLSDTTSPASLADSHQPQGPPLFFPEGAGSVATRPFCQPGNWVAPGMWFR